MHVQDIADRKYPSIYAAKLMLRRGIGSVPVVDNKGKLVAIVDREDIVRTLIK
ncbi:MAG: CBS domain-containing protein [Candidatus Bathyarchaeota archaeon]